jgi:hypothetical protein
MSTKLQSASRYVGRYVVAAWMIPVGVVLGVGGLAQNWSRSLRRRPRRSAAEPVGRPEGSGLERLGDS